MVNFNDIEVIYVKENLLELEVLGDSYEYFFCWEVICFEKGILVDKWNLFVMWDYENF